MATIYHITTADQWQRSQSYYEAASLRSEGFIHCSDANQVIRVANRLFKATPNLVLLHIETEKLTSRLVYENLEGGEELFPHIYGPIELDAIAGITSFEPQPNGTFDRHLNELKFV